tara:strand:+ start:892 stop:1446 length:555 start_codon:yes stop_codon:yes gene_type:complete
MIKNILNIFLVFLMLFGISSCHDPSKPNYQYFPNMYEPVGYEAYADSDAFSNGIEAQEPVNGTISRGWKPYEFENTNEGYELAKDQLKSPILDNEKHLSNGKELYSIYCAVCHGDKGDGQGILMTREKFLGIPNYTDREITKGSIYHVLMYGKNSMGSHAGQVNEIERWEIAQYVMKLRNKLLK